MSNDKPIHPQMLRTLPAVHRVIEHDIVKAFNEQNKLPHSLLVSAAQEVVEKIRQQILSGNIKSMNETSLNDWIAEQIILNITHTLSPKLQKVINGTGVVLHTNLGRALLSDAAIKQVVETATHYSNLEYDIEAGQRGSRHSHVEALICKMTGAEAAMVVNNNAAAVFLVLKEIAMGKEVIVSRGQLVEIGGSFRISEIMKESGCQLVEVGTTNKTHLYDYEQAITEETALLMKVHTSNFRTIGFTSSVSLDELAELANQKQIPVYEDLGSGALCDLRPFGIGDEPTVREVLEAGADVVSFSGDKLLGGPQAGIIAGRKQWIDRFKKNQLMRILRVDKMSLTALEVTLRQYLQLDQAKQEIPVLRDLLMPLQEIREKAETFAANIKGTERIQVKLIEDYSEVGGGTMPGITIPTIVAEILVAGESAHHTEKKLRGAHPPVISRVAKDCILIDFRTILWDEVEILAEVFRSVMK